MYFFYGLNCNIFHRLMCSNTWSPVGNASLENCGNFRRWRLSGIGGSRSLGFYCLALLPVCFVLWYNVTLCSEFILPSNVIDHILQMGSQNKPSILFFKLLLIRLQTPRKHNIVYSSTLCTSTLE